MLRRLASVAALLLVCACADTAQAPVARPVLPPAAHVGAAVLLDGSTSSSQARRDGPALALHFRWSLESSPVGSRARVEHADLARATLTPDLPGRYGIRLVVTDGVYDSNPVSVDFTADDTCRPVPATVTASPAAPAVGQPAALAVTAAKGCDADGAATITKWRWSVVSAPAGSRAGILLPDTAAASFTPDVRGDYELAVQLTNALGLATAIDDPAAHLKLSAAACGDNAPRVTATRSSPADPNVADLVQLAADVEDADTLAPCNLNRTLAFEWSVRSLPAGVLIELNLPTAANPSFVPEVPGNYVFDLVVRDELGRASATTELAVTVSTCGSAAPTARVVAPPSVFVGAVVPLSTTIANADVDACHLDVSYRFAWSLAVPAGSRAVLDDATRASPTFVPDVAGTYTPSVVVTASNGKAGRRAAADVASDACGSLRPTAVVSAPDGAATGLAVGLSASVVDPNEACLRTAPYTYAWTFSARPPGSLSRLSGADEEGVCSQAAPSFVPDRPGDYALDLVVRDRAGLASLPLPSVVRVVDCTAPVSAGIVAPAGAGTGQLVELTADILDPNEPSAGSACLRPVFPLAYAWRIVGQPPGSRTMLNAPGSSHPSLVPSVEGTYDFELVVTDAAGNRSAPARASLVVASCRAPLTVDVVAPTGAGTGSPVGLSALVGDPNTPGAGPNGCTAAVAPFTYAWRLVGLPASSRAELTHPGASAPTFVPDVAGSYAVSLVVTDAAGNRSPAATANVSVAGCRAPLTASIVAPNGIATGRQTTLSATVTDPNSPGAGSSCLAGVLPYTYAWSLIGRPAGSHASLDSRVVTSPSFGPDVAGSFAVQLVVIDAAGNRSNTATADLTAADCGAPLTAGIVAPAGAATRTAVGLAATVLDPNDPAANAACIAAVAPLQYRWALVGRPAGSAAVLNAGGAASPSFTPDVPGTYAVTLDAADAAGNRSHTATADVTVADCGAPLTVVVGTPPTSITGAATALTATVTDPNTTCGNALPYTYRWALVGVPPGSRTALNAAGAASPSFTPDLAGTYAATLTVTDALGNTGVSGTATVAAVSCNLPIAAALVLPAGAATGAPVALDATVTDPNAPDGLLCSAVVLPYAFRWTLDSRPPASRAVLNSAVAGRPSLVPDVAGDYVVSLVVTDAAGNRSPAASGTVTATSCTDAPAIAIATVSVASTGLAVPLTATIADPNGSAACGLLVQPYAYAWTLESAPGGSAASLNAAAAVSPSFVPDLAGSYTVSLVVTDAAGNRSPRSRQTIVAGSCSAAPVVAVANVVAFTGQPVAISATVTDPNDPSTNLTCTVPVAPFTYQWTIVDQPAGSQAALNASGAVSPSLTPDVGGTYAVAVVVTDANGNKSAPASGTVTVVGCNKPPAVTIVSAGGPGPVALSATVVDPNPASCGAASSASYFWSLPSTPPGSGAFIDRSQSATPGFLADRPGSYLVSLQVGDARGNVTTTEKVLTFAACGPGPAVVVSSTAASIVGQNVQLSAVVTDASAAPCGGPTAAPYGYVWTLNGPAGSNATVDARDGGASFLADLAGTYTWTVAVTDAFGLTKTTSGSVIAIDCTLKPTIRVLGTPPFLTYSPVGLVGVATRNGVACVNPYSLRWSVQNGPPESRGDFTSRTAAQTNFTPDVPNGTWLVRLEAIDATTGAVTSTTASLTSNACGALGPISAAGISLPFPISKTVAQPNPLATPTAAYLAGYTIQLDASLAADPSAACAGPLSYRWSVYSRPFGSNSAPTPPYAAKPWFVLDVVGDFVLKLVVSDGRFTSAPGFLHVVVEDPLKDLVPSIAAAPVKWNDMAIDPADGLPSIAYYQLNGGSYDLRFTHCIANCDTEGASSQWTAPQTIEASLATTGDFVDGAQVSLEYLGPSRPAVAYHNITLCMMSYGVSTGGASGAGTWQTSLIDMTQTPGGCGNVHGEIDLQLVGAARVPAVAYHTHRPNNGARFAVCKTNCLVGTNTTWTIQWLDNSGNVGHNMTMFVDPVSKLPRAAYQDNSNFLRYATCADGPGTSTCANALGSWSMRTIDNTLAEWNSIALTPAGIPSIAYEDVGNSLVKLATCTGVCGTGASSTWSFQTIEAGLGGGDYFTRLQFDAAGQARITYVKPSTQVLRYAVQAGAASFNYFDIDRQVDDGHSSFILTTAGSTHVSYALTTGLKYYPFGD